MSGVVSWPDIGRFTCNWTRNNRWESWHARRVNIACSIVRTCRLLRASKGIKTMQWTVDRELGVAGRRRLQFDSNCRLVSNNSDNYALLISPRLFRSDWPNVFPRNTWNNSWIVDRLIGQGDYQPRKWSSRLNLFTDCARKNPFTMYNLYQLFVNFKKRLRKVVTMNIFIQITRYVVFVR